MLKVSCLVKMALFSSSNLLYMRTVMCYVHHGLIIIVQMVTQVSVLQYIAILNHYLYY